MHIKLKYKYLLFSKVFLLISLMTPSFLVSAKEIVVEPGGNAYERLQEAMILMNEGDVLLIKSGYYKFEDGLSLDVNDVTILGEGMDETILDFQDQQSGAQGLLVTSDGVTLKNFSILDASSTSTA